jgi:FHS family L-fucose permease-like MFS transporter
MSVKPATSTHLLLYLVNFIYFFNGMALCFEGAFNPEFKEIFNLDYAMLMMTMFAKNLPFVVFSLAIGHLAQRIGFRNCLSAAMFLFAAGTLLLIPGLQTSQYTLVLTAFFLIGTGFNFQLVAGNPMLSQLGDPAGSSSRLNLGNALGAIAQIIAPLLITLIVPATVITASDKLPYILGIFLAVAIILVVTGVITLFAGKKNDTYASPQRKAKIADDTSWTKVWTNRRLILGFLAIFLAIGIEAGIFGLFRNYLEDPFVAGLSAHQSQRWFTAYFAAYALGRLAGSLIQKHIKPRYNLAFNTAAAMICIVVTITTRGTVAIAFLLLTGFFISIFFPTLYAISIEGLGNLTAKASGLLTMGFLGAALIPVGQGRLADIYGLQSSFYIAFLPYLFILYFALKGYEMKPASATSKT